VIRSFRSKDTASIWNETWARTIPRDIQRRALLKLQMLNAASELRDLAIPSSNRLEALKGKRRGQYSIRVNDQWRICFRWTLPDAHDVELVDYHD
jgi:proteic killer suppression protein